MLSVFQAVGQLCPFEVVHSTQLSGICKNVLGFSGKEIALWRDLFNPRSLGLTGSDGDYNIAST